MGGWIVDLPFFFLPLENSDSFGFNIQLDFCSIAIYVCMELLPSIDTVSEFVRRTHKYI